MPQPRVFLPSTALALALGLPSAPASALADGVFADGFESCQGQPGCWLTVKPAQVDAQWAAARCNDGTPAGYELRPSPTGSHDWVVLFEGGGSCDDLTLPCVDRGTALTTTPAQPNGRWAPLFHGGILNPDPAINPDFADANLVQLDYCSSDQWSGATTIRHGTSATPGCAADDTTCGWYFSGRLNAGAAIASLVRDHGLIDDGSRRVLFVGTSAGGFGLSANAEAMTQALPQTFAADGLRFVIDGGYVLDGWDQPGHVIGASTLTAVNAVAAQNRAFWNASFETACERDRRANGLDPALCSLGSVWYPYLSGAAAGLHLKLLLQNSTLDAVATERLMLTDPDDPAREAWRCAMTASLRQAAWLFSSGDVYHTLSVSNQNFAAGPAGNTYRDLVGRFWRDRTPQRVVVHNPPCP